METLLKTYRDYKPSERCYLDARAITTVLSEFPGFLPEVVKIHLHEFAEVDEDDEHVRQEFHATLKSKTIQFGSEVDMLRVVIKVKTHETTTREEPHIRVKATTKHSNLLIVDHTRKEIYRFEPLMSFKFNDIVNDVLVSALEDVLPDYAFIELDNHPQQLDSKKCKGRGMCVAYVLKAGVQYALGQEISFPADSDDDINRFASAVEALYPIHTGEPEREYGSGGWFLGGALLGGLAGYLLAPRRRAVMYDPYYDPYYYGPYYGPRYYYTSGWRGRGHWRGGDRRHPHGGRGGRR